MTRLVGLVLLAAAAANAAGEGRAIEYARALETAALDPEQCYHVRDLTFQKDELKFYLTEGRLIFAKPVEGRIPGAIFTSDVPGGDAELIVFPPLRSERLSLASFAKTPNLNEHFAAAALVFSDGTGEQLLEQIRTSQAGPRKAQPEAALMLAERHTDTLRNLLRSYEIRLVQDHFSGHNENAGFFYATVTGRTHGNIDLVYDPRQRDQITIGQLVYRGDRRYFDVWASFQARSFRVGRRKAPVSTVSVKKVAIDATILPDLSMKALTRMTFTGNEDAGSAVAFELSNRVHVTAARFNGQPVEVFSRESLRADLVRQMEGNSTFVVVLPKPLTPGESHTLEFEHEGNVVSDAGNGVYFVGARTSWYPNRDAAFAQYDLTFRHPKQLQLVATGELVSESTEGEMRIARHTTSAPIRFAGFNLGNYIKATTKSAGVNLEVYANRTIEQALQQRARDVIILPPPNPFPRGGARRSTEIMTIPAPAHVPSPTARLAELAGEIGSALEYMSARFGPPPLKSLTIAPIPGTFGQGFPGLVYLSTLAYLNPSDRPATVQSEYQRMFFSEMLHAHETAHQWWGNLVTSASYQDDWLMEALANYSAMMILEKKKGRRALDSVLDEYRDHLLARTPEGKPVESAGPIIWGVRLSSSQSPGAWRTIMYEKGSWILHMLRVRLGDDQFVKMLGELAKRKRYQPVTTDEFRLLAAEFLPPRSEDPKLEAFFDQWVYNTGIPQIRMKYDVQGKAPKVRVKGTITQHDVDEEFSALVPVEIQLPGKKTVTRWVRTSSEPVAFTVDLNVAPVKVVLDPANGVLSRK